MQNTKFKYINNNYYNSGLMILIKAFTKYFQSNIKTNRTLVVPEPFLSQPLEEYFHITSKNYDFLVTSKPICSEIYTIMSDTPSSLLKKNAIHIFPESVSQLTAQQKYKAYVKRLQEEYEKSYQKCKTAAEIFHMERRIKTDIKQRCRFIGRILGKHKHYNLFKSINQINKDKTMEEYKKNGVSISLLGKLKIFPQGPVWLPTTDSYLKLLQEYINKMGSSPQQIMDIGCGSGVLSYILSRGFKNSKIVALDNNKHAIETTEVNAAAFGLKNIQTIVSDITNLQDLEFKLKQRKCGSEYDLIISNPPWLIAKRNKHESQILDGVYDQKGKFLESCFKIAKRHLKNKNARFILLYSDLSHILGIQPKSIQQLCKQNNLLVHSKLETDYPKAIQNQSPLSKYKLKSKIQLYQFGLS